MRTPTDEDFADVADWWSRRAVALERIRKPVPPSLPGFRWVNSDRPEMRRDYDADRILRGLPRSARAQRTALRLFGWGVSA